MLSVSYPDLLSTLSALSPDTLARMYAEMTETTILTNAIIRSETITRLVALVGRERAEEMVKHFSIYK